jgi:hypothetical protein
VVDHQVYRDRQQHPAERAARRDGQGPPAAQLARDGLPADLQAEHEEEQCHGRVVDDVPQIEVEAVPAHVEADRGLPQRDVAGRPRQVRPDQGDDSCSQQDDSAAGLIGDEPPRRGRHLGCRDAQGRAWTQNSGHLVLPRSGQPV